MKCEMTEFKKYDLISHPVRGIQMMARKNGDWVKATTALNKINQLEKDLADMEEENLQQAEIIGKDIDGCDKLIMEKRGLEVELERMTENNRWLGGLLDEVVEWAQIVIDEICKNSAFSGVPYWKEFMYILTKYRASGGNGETR